MQEFVYSKARGTAATAAFVFVRKDAVRKPLAPTYEGPYAVLERSPKAMRVDLGGRPDWVAIDRVKPAHVDGLDPVVVEKKRGRGRPRKRQKLGGAM